MKSGDVTTARASVAKGADVNAPEPDGTTALHWAVQRNDVDLVSAADCAPAPRSTSRTTYGATPMSEAALTANPALLEALLKAGADVESPNADGQTALMVVARTGQRRGGARAAEDAAPRSTRSSSGAGRRR